MFLGVFCVFLCMYIVYVCVRIDVRKPFFWGVFCFYDFKILKSSIDNVFFD
jgi:hypothetical protein